MSTFHARFIPVSRLRLLVPALLLLLGAAILGAPTAQAGGTVTNCSTYGSGAGTLQAALGGGGAITFVCSGTIIVPGIAINANTPTVIDATGQDVTLSGNNVSRVFIVNNGKSLTLRNITVANGRVQGFGAGAYIQPGGTLIVENSTFTGNSAVIPSGDGGAIFNEHGTVTVTDSAITGNSAVGKAGGINNLGNLTLTNSTVSGNTAQEAGGLFGEGGSTTVLLNSTVTANRAADYGGGIQNYDGVVSMSNTIVAGNSARSGSYGPDVSGRFTSNDYNLIGTVTGATFTPAAHDITGVDPLLGPLADNGGPTETHALLPGSPAIDAGNTTLTADQRGEPRPFGLADDIGAFELQTCDVDSWPVSNEAELNAAIACFNAKTVAGSYTITVTQDIPVTASTTVINNATSGVSLVIEGDGHAVDGQGTAGVRPFEVAANTTVTMNHLTVTGGKLTGTNITGGGVYNSGNLTLNNVTVTGNSVEKQGAGIFANAGNLTINNSTVSGNTSVGSGNSFGGGIYVQGGTATIRNSTISGNSANDDGGGIAVLFGIVSIDSSTIAYNSALSGGGFFGFFTSSSTAITNTIIAANSGGPDCDNASIPLIDGGHNLVQTQSGCGFTNGVNGNIVGQNPMLGPLANNGGDTQTHLPNAGSPTIDAGDTALTTDQRGIARPFGVADDIGAVEVDTCPASPWNVANESELNFAIGCYNTQTAPGSYTITVTHDITLTASTTTISNTTSGVSLVIEGYGYAVDGQDTAGVRPFNVAANTTVTMTALTVSGGNLTGASDHGGGIHNEGNLTLNQCTVSNNSAYFGGGVSNKSSLVVVDSDFYNNQGGGGGGGLENYAGGMTTISGSIFWNNTAGNTGGEGTGAGLQNSAGTVTVTNSTFSGNQALGTTDEGGGAIMHYVGALTLQNITVANNSSATKGGGISQTGGTVTLNNAIVANNSATGSGPNLAGTITSNDYNLVEDTSGATFTPQAHDITGVDPVLGPLDDNGGETRTHALLGGSPAIDAGSTSLTIDQRGVTRPQFVADDIGAYESLCGTATGWTAATDLELDTAIDCFNKQTVAGSYVITVTGNFSVTDGPQAINNPTVGPSLVIEGGNHTIDGEGRQGFGIQSATDVTMNDLTLTDWRNLLGGGAIRHDNVDSHLMLNNMTLTHNTSGFGAGALFSRGVVTITTSTFFSNTNSAQSGAGAIEINGPGKLTLIDSKLTANTAAGNGGAILAESNPTIIIEGSLINGNSAAESGGGIHAESGTSLSITRSTIDGNTAAGAGGGGIYNSGTLVIEQSTVSNNSNTDANASGGGISNSGTLTMRNSTVSGNTARSGGGITSISANLTLDSVTIANNTANGAGSALYYLFTAPTMANSILAGNNGAEDCAAGASTPVVTDNGHNLVGTQSGCGFTNGVNGNIVGSDPALGPLDDNGGETFTHALLGGSPALDAGDTTLTTDQRGVTRPQFVADDIGAYESLCGTATAWTAATDLELDTAIGCFNKQTVAGSYTISVTANISLTTSIASINNPTSGPSLVIVGGDHTIDGGDAPGNLGKGGFIIDSPTAVSITDLTVTRCRLLLSGGAIRNFNGGALTLNNVTLTQNRAGFGGGALSSNGPVTISNSVISYNYNPAGAGGGGILIESPGSLTLKNSTVSGNTSDVTGGGIHVQGGSASLDSVTVADNSAPTGGGIAQTGGTVTLVNTIVGNNSASGSGPDLSGTITSNDYNLIEDVAGATFAPQAHDITGVDPLLDPLADNGGDTETHALLAGSPAIDAGDTTLTTDQRGVARPQAAADDIGAFELLEVACPAFPLNVANEGELNFAIGCYNGQTAPSVYTINVTQGISLTASTTVISNTTAGVRLVIEGSSHAVDGQDTAGVRPFEIAGGTTVTMRDLNVSGGNMAGLDNGGGIKNTGILTLNNATVSDNTADAGGGGIDNSGSLVIEQSTVANNSNTDANASGGGISNSGTLTMRNSTVSGNTARSGGGITSISANLTLDSVTIANNTANGGGSGLFYLFTAPTMANSILAGNNGAEDCAAGASTPVVTDNGHNLVGTQSGCGFTNGVNGNIVGSDPVLGPLADNGGKTETHALLTGSPALDAGDTALATDQRGKPRPFGLADDIGAFELQTCYVDSWSVGNEAELNAAIACYNTKTVAGSYTITVTQGISLTASTTAINNANSGVSLVIEGSGYAVDGQDIADVRPFYVQNGTTVTINDLTVTGGNKIGSGEENRGGGILNRGNLTLNRSTVISNTVESRGGGIALRGGTLEISESTIAYNISGTSSPGFGGGIYSEDGQITIRNSTISGNESVGGGQNNPNLGGGIASNANVTLDSVTVTDNYAFIGAGLHFKNRTTSQVTVSVKNTILANNGGEDCYFETIAGGATVNDQGHNLVRDDSLSNPCGIVAGANNNIGGDPRLLPLADYGGPTQTHAFRLDSPAIDAGDTSLPADQRGVTRPQDLADDIGALESTLCSNDSWAVKFITELNAAIECFNAKTTPGIYTITILEGGGPAYLSTTPIDNITPGVSLVIEGQGETLDWNGNLFPGHRPFLIQPNTTVTINDLEITGGNVLGTEWGGGILNFGNLTLNRSIIRGNRAEFDGGGINNHGVMVINDSTVSGNIIEGGSAPVDGGGIYNEGSLTIRNSTISRNISSNDGGGIGNFGTLDLDSVTVTANTAEGAVGGGAGAGVFISATGTLTTRNSILAGNLNAEDCWAADPVTDGGHNLVETQINCGFVNGVNGSIVGQSANLGPLRNNGGPTQTHALLPGSPAINAGDTTLTTDQRGAPRPAGAADDMGAYEAQAASITIVKDATPADDTPFDFTFDDGNTSTDFTLSDPSAITETFTFLSAGVYTVTEALAAGWDLAGVTCVLADGSPAATVPVERGVGITLASIDGVTCTFTNTKLGSLTVVKNTVGGDGTFEFSSQTLTPTLFSLTTVGGTAQRVFDDLLPGVTYDITETVPMGWVLTSATCDDGSPVGAITIDPGEAVTCTFLNNIQTPTALTLSGLKATANGPALAWPWLLALGSAALGAAWVVRRRRSTTA